jgi:hypothetical protein
MGKKWVSAGLAFVVCLCMTTVKLLSQPPSEFPRDPGTKGPAAAMPANGKSGAVADGFARLEQIRKQREMLDREEGEIIAAIQAILEEQRKEIAAVEEQLRRYTARNDVPAASGEKTMKRDAWPGFVGWLAGLCPDCIERRFVVYSDPPGAFVYVNNQGIGATPMDYWFTDYGKYEFVLVKDGYETLNVTQDIPARWDELLSLAHISWVPRFKIRDVRSFCYTLKPIQQPPPAAFPLAEGR